MGWTNYGAVIKEGQAHAIRLGKECLPLEEIFWGPEMFEACFARDIAHGLYDISQAGYSEYGSLVVDYDKRYLLLFGDNLSYDIALRRVCLSLLTKTWPGWRVEWADNGHMDIARYLGIPFDEAFQRFSAASTASVLTDEDLRRFFTRYPHDDPEGVLTMGEFDHLRILPIFSSFYDELLLLAGERVCGIVRALPSLDELTYDVTHTDPMHLWFPGIGIHLEPAGRKLSFWLSDPFQVKVHWVEQHWPGWQIQYWGSAYEKQLALSSGRIRFITKPEEYYIDCVKQQVTVATPELFPGQDLAAQFERLLGK